jgi:hypothetical protein
VCEIARVVMAVPMKEDDTLLAEHMHLSYSIKR